jgi:hypothetical protein
MLSIVSSYIGWFVFDGRSLLARNFHTEPSWKLYQLGAGDNGVNTEAGSCPRQMGKELPAKKQSRVEPMGHRAWRMVARFAAAAKGTRLREPQCVNMQMRDGTFPSTSKPPNRIPPTAHPA